MTLYEATSKCLWKKKLKARFILMQNLLLYIRFAKCLVITAFIHTYNAMEYQTSKQQPAMFLYTSSKNHKNESKKKISFITSKELNTMHKCTTASHCTPKDVYFNNQKEDNKRHGKLVL